MGFFKKAFKIFHPVESKLFGIGGNKGDGGQGLMELGQSQGRQADLDAAMKDYENIPQHIRDQYTSAAQKAGTYANTPEFQSGLGSEVNAGVRGARVDAVARINSLRKAMGNNEEFKPEGFDQTQANNTQDKLAENPLKEDSSAPVATPDAPQAQDAGGQMNAAAGVQSAAPKAAGRKGFFGKEQAPPPPQRPHGGSFGRIAPPRPMAGPRMGALQRRKMF